MRQLPCPNAGSNRTVACRFQEGRRCNPTCQDHLDARIVGVTRETTIPSSREQRCLAQKIHDHHVGFVIVMEVAGGDLALLSVHHSSDQDSLFVSSRREVLQQFWRSLIEPLLVFLLFFAGFDRVLSGTYPDKLLYRGVIHTDHERPDVIG